MKLNSISERIDHAIQYDVNVEKGLNSEQVSERISSGLTNYTKKRVTKSYPRIFFDNIVNFFNIVLFIIAGALIWCGAGVSRLLFLFILCANILIGIIQDIHARRLVDKIRVNTVSKITVIRNGEKIEVVPNDIVLSDIVELKLGEQIPCDGKVVSGEFEVNEALLTGEADDIKKTIGSSVYSGSYVVSGTARILVEKISTENYCETLQDKAKEFKRPKSEILRSISRIFVYISIFVIGLGTALIVTYACQGKFNTLENTKTSIIAIAGSLVSMIPTGMYLLTSLTLAVGVIKLAKRKTLVQEMYSIETLARVDTLCLDKTGTLTDGTLKVEKIVSLSKTYSIDEIKQILKSLVAGTKDTNAVAQAILSSEIKCEIIEATSYVPFSSKRKFSAVNLSNGHSYIMGAYGFTGFEDKEIEKQIEEYSLKGYRVLTISSSKSGIDANSKLTKISPVGIIVLSDHIKEDAYETIKSFQDAEVAIRVISGDDPLTVKEIANKVGINNADKAINLEGMPLEEVKRIANDYVVYGRVTPEQKEALICGLKQSGKVVAMTGDGVNDVLALKSADCSIAMASGSSAAKNVAHLVSLDSNFAQLRNVVGEGRRVINNLERSSSLFLTKTTFAILCTIVALIFGWATQSISYPFSTNNMYVWEFAAIGMGSFFMALQPNDEPIKKCFIKNVLYQAIPAGIIIACIAIISIFGLHNKTIGVIAFSTFSIISFITIAWPFDIYRLVLSIGVTVVAILMFVIDILLPASFKENFKFLDIDYSLINGNNWWWILVLIIGATIVYFLIRFVIKKIRVGHNEQD